MRPQSPCLVSDSAEPAEGEGLKWLHYACLECSSAYSLSWSALALLAHRDSNLDRCVGNLNRALNKDASPSNVEALSLAVIAIDAVQRGTSPFGVGNRQ